jgi:hypothetical protein
LLLKIRNFFALYFSLFIMHSFAKETLFYSKFNVRLFKLINSLSPWPNP